ncbi:MAG: TVP38/TMEM64 family protein [Caulobacteraceae bacterium]
MVEAPGPEPRPRSLRRNSIVIVVFAAAALFLLFGAQAFGLGGEASARRWLILARGPLALPAVIAAFAAMAFAGVPQVALIAAAVAVFGPWLGGLYSWLGTMISALVGFWLGRVTVAPSAGWKLGRRTERLMALIARNGFIASLLVRLAPFAPFVLINMTAGASSMRTAAFAAGTAIGIVPKIVLTAAAGRLAAGLLSGGALVPVVFFVLALGGWIGASLLARRWLGGRG